MESFVIYQYSYIYICYDLNIFIKQNLLKTICQQVKENLQFISVSIEKEFRFVCQECDSSSDPHYLLPSPDGISTACQQKTRVYRHFTLEEAYWFPDAVLAEVSSGNTPQLNIYQNENDFECKNKCMFVVNTVLGRDRD